MIAALSIAVVVQALALGAVALRLAWPSKDEASGPDTVGGDVVRQDEEYDEAGSDPTIGFRAASRYPSVLGRSP